MSADNNNKNVQVTPLKENELGQIEGGFAELPSIAPSEIEDINTLCGTNICLGYTTTSNQ